MDFIESITFSGIWIFISGAFSLALIAIFKSFIIGVIEAYIGSLNRSFFIYKILSKILSITGARIFNEGDWYLYWYVKDSENFPEPNPSKISMHSFGKILIGEWITKDKQGNLHTYRLSARIISDRIEGRWFDKSETGYSYHGVFQMIINKVADKCEGRWLGFDSKNQVKNGKIVLAKNL